MILLMGGTSETARLSEAMASAGFSVLVSMATDIPLALPEIPAISVRRGRLNSSQLTALILHKQITVLVDAAHPYALEAHRAAKQAARNTDISYIRWLRGESDLSLYPNLCVAADHQEAARLAPSFERPILLTIGTRNMAPYVEAARKAELPLYARVLPCGESEQACDSVGLSRSQIIAARGPFSVEDTSSLLRELKIGVLVTKESGAAGGVPEKLDAAARANCRVVIVRRAAVENCNVCRTIGELIKQLCRCTEATAKTGHWLALRDDSV